jgi:hypothetical protein
VSIEKKKDDIINYKMKKKKKMWKATAIACFNCTVSMTMSNMVLVFPLHQM